MRPAQHQQHRQVQRGWGRGRGRACMGAVAAAHCGSSTRSGCVCVRGWVVVALVAQEAMEVLRRVMRARMWELEV